MKSTTTTRPDEEAKAFLDFVDSVAVILYGHVYDDCAPVQKTVVLEQVELIHQEQVN